jgi:hypothetical protein
MRKSNRQAKAAKLAAALEKVGWRHSSVKAPLEAGVVVMVSVAVPELEPVTFTGLVVPKLNVGGFWAPAGADVIAADKTTLPVKLPAGVTITVEMLAVVDPGAVTTAVPAMVKAALTGPETITVELPLAAG